jgi:hypothetical protein
MWCYDTEDHSIHVTQIIKHIYHDLLFEPKPSVRNEHVKGIS